MARERLGLEDVQPSAQILRFRPRQNAGSGSVAAAADRGGAANDGELLDDLAQYEELQEDDEDVDYPRRMLMNVIAVAVVTILIGVGVWLADTIADMERDQDCVLQGRQNCAPIELASPLHK
ncbi:MAG: hypothetical protein WBF58_01600 [Xanthobacteraceae bacterium]